MNKFKQKEKWIPVIFSELVCCVLFLAWMITNTQQDIFLLAIPLFQVSCLFIFYKLEDKLFLKNLRSRINLWVN